MSLSSLFKIFILSFLLILSFPHSQVQVDDNYTSVLNDKPVNTYKTQQFLAFIKEFAETIDASRKEKSISYENQFVSALCHYNIRLLNGDKKQAFNFLNKAFNMNINQPHSAEKGFRFVYLLTKASLDRSASEFQEFMSQWDSSKINSSLPLFYESRKERSIEKFSAEWVFEAISTFTLNYKKMKSPNFGEQIDLFVQMHSFIVEELSIGTEKSLNEKKQIAEMINSYLFLESFLLNMHFEMFSQGPLWASHPFESISQALKKFCRCLSPQGQIALLIFTDKIAERELFKGNLCNSNL